MLFPIISCNWLSCGLTSKHSMIVKCLILLICFLTCVFAGANESLWQETARPQRQTDTHICTLPPYPENGTYLVEDKPDASPGDKLVAVQVRMSCNPGYRLQGKDTLYCVQGAWSDERPKCIRYCKLIKHPSVNYLCQVSMSGSEENYYYRDCEDQEPTGMIVRPKCNEPNYHYPGLLSHMHCVEGRWNYIAICQPECGTVTPDGNTLITDGRESKKGEFPWHAGIYRKDFTPFKLICGGSLVSSTVIISAAHCFWNKQEHKLRPASSFAVALGKLYRGWNSSLDKESQKFDVENIKVPVRFQGAQSNYQEDIAVVLLSAPAEYQTHIRPVCLDFNPIFDAHQLRDGNVGKVAGWGVKDLEGNPSQVLQVLALPYVKIRRCFDEFPSNFKPYITSDKICAGYGNGSAVCQGDSGGGLVFRARVRFAERYYLRGVVSTAPETEAACNVFSRATFTKITKHRIFIEKNTISFEQSTSEFQDSENICVLPPYPENGGYSMLGLPTARPGESYYSVRLVVTCNTGFVLERNSEPSCTNGGWTEYVTKCIPAPTDRCRRPADWGATYKCSDDVNSSKRPCNEFEPNGTMVTRECSPEKYLSIFNRTVTSTDVAHCVNGVWDGDLGCVADKNCGMVTLPGGSELPWVAAIYKINKLAQSSSSTYGSPKQYVCGATIINNKHVLTAGHCIWEIKARSPVKASDYTMAMGKLYPKYDDPRDSHAVFAEITEILLSNLYHGSFHTSDIAMIVLKKRLKINTYVRPVCVDWSFNINSVKNAVAKTASWRITNAKQEYSIEKALLRSVAVKITDRKQCLEEIGSTYQKLLTADKICAVDLVGQGVCRGDSGLALVLEVGRRYHLLGTTSVGLSEITCSADQPIGFTSTSIGV